MGEMVNVETVISMPVYNEAEGIRDFISEIRHCFDGNSIQFVVVDDCSQDSTIIELQSMVAEGYQIEILRNGENLGHGPSTLRGLKHSLGLKPLVVLTVDGDGQISGDDLYAIYRKSVDELSLIEGIRSDRGDVWFRRLVSWMTRELVREAVGSIARDANTPFRAYSLPVLRKILDAVPPDTLTPNIFISAWVRGNGIPFGEIEIRSLPRRAQDSRGSTWNQRRKNVPSLVFLKFCWRAFAQWVSLRRNLR